MIHNILSENFFKIYKELNGEDIKKTIIISDNSNALENALRNYLVQVIGYRNSYVDNFKEIEIAFENIIRNMDSYNTDLIKTIEQYTKDYTIMLDNHPYTKLLIKAVNSLYSEKYDIKNSERNSMTDGFNTAIKHVRKRLEIIRLHRINEEAMPSMFITNIDDFENVLIKYIENIKNSETYYNIFYREGFANISDEEKVKMIYEGTLLNITHHDAQNIEIFFKNYSNFISDNTFNSIQRPVQIGNLFNDDLYVMAKRSELWYETPYYLSFMLNNQRIELPNVRMGLSDVNGKKTAYIVATQTAQMILNQQNYDELQKIIKSKIPSNNYFRFYNPTHVISLVLTFGMLNGLGIQDVIVKDYMPFRYKKVINDKQLNEEEAEIYQTRLTTKNIATYMRIASNIKGIDVFSYPDIDSELHLNIANDLIGDNEFLNELLAIGVELGKKLTQPEQLQKNN